MTNVKVSPLGGNMNNARIEVPVGMIVTALGWALVFRSGVGLVLGALTLIPVVGRIQAEEKMLASEFGPAWDAYRSRTWRLLPFVY